jgi:hypothetical protein
MVVRSVGWLVGWSVGWSVCRSVGWSVGRSVSWLVGCSGSYVSSDHLESLIVSPTGIQIFSPRIL